MYKVWLIEYNNKICITITTTNDNTDRDYVMYNQSYSHSGEYTVLTKSLESIKYIVKIEGGSGWVTIKSVPPECLDGSAGYSMSTDGYVGNCWIFDHSWVKIIDCLHECEYPQELFDFGDKHPEYFY